MQILQHPAQHLNQYMCDSFDQSQLRSLSFMDGKEQKLLSSINGLNLGLGMFCSPRASKG